jgi:diguanylate cyclase (GGDEF)-like protein
MNYRASHDALTGCLNRSEFDAQLRRVLTRLSDDHNDSAVLFIDLDQFKLINDTCGHTAGDLLLQQVSKILSEAIRGSDILARLGGDEFGIILDHCPIDQARRVSQQICDRMNDFRFTHDDRRFRVGCSIGLVPVDARWENSNQLMQAADTACYAAKEAGRNRVHTWSDSDLALQVRQGEMNWAARIQQAIDEDRFVLFMQRVERIDRTGGGMSGLHGEVLLRLPNAQGDLIAPGAFLPAAERFHMATRIDRWVFLKVADRLASMPDLTGIDSIAINLSGQSIGDRSFHRYVVEILGDVAFDRSKLCFEITETAAITNLPDAILFIEEMRRLGVRIALDDFGAGASSFGYLKSLPVDILKIDGQFIRDLTSDRLDAITVRCFHDVAKTMGISTVAECVETAEVMRALAEIGIDYAQGYYLHRPEALDNLLGSATGKTRAVRRRVRL